MQENRHLRCPACENILSPIKAGAVVVDICHNGCGGVWFDKDELYKVDNKQEHDGDILLNIRKKTNFLIDQEKIRICPVCKDVKMRKHFYSPKLQTFEIDECDKCGGIWLDNKEINVIKSVFENNKDKLSYEGSYMSALSYELIDMAEEEAKNKPKLELIDRIFYTIFGC